MNEIRAVIVTSPFYVDARNDVERLINNQPEIVAKSIRKEFDDKFDALIKKLENLP